jgi:alpha-1,6-mannosyltransferase
MHVVDTTVLFSPTSGGVRRYLSAKHAWLAQHTRVTHSLLVPGERTELNRGEVSTLKGWKVPGTFNYRLPLDPFRWNQALHELEPDLIEVGDAFHPAWAAWRVAQKRRIPLAAFYHSNLPQLVERRYGRVTGKAFAHYVRWLYERFDVVFAPSRYICDYLHAIGVTHTALQPLGVDTEVFHPARRVRDLRHELGLPQQTRLLAFAGRFSAEKKIDVLRAAFARLGAPYHLLLIGGADSARLDANVTCVPYRRDSVDLAEWLASADALVHAGTRETFGLVLLEAMACGLPVVAARAGAVPEIVTPEVGLLAEPDDSASFADAVAALYEAPFEPRRLAARARAVSTFSWRQTFRTQLGTYRKLVHGMEANRVTSPAPALHACSLHPEAGPIAGLQTQSRRGAMAGESDDAPTAA